MALSRYAIYRSYDNSYNDTLWEVGCYTVRPDAFTWAEIISDIQEQGFDFQADKTYVIQNHGMENEVKTPQGLYVFRMEAPESVALVPKAVI